MGSTVGTLEERLILTIAHIRRGGGHAQLERDALAEILRLRTAITEPPADAEVAQAYEKGVNEAVNAARFVVWGMDGESNTAIVNELLKIKVKGSPELAIAHDLAQAQRAVIEAAMREWTSLDGEEAECLHDLHVACAAVADARQRLAAAKEQG